MPNNRQLAIMLWLLVALAFALRSPGVRRSLGNVSRSLSNKTLLIPIVGFLASVSALLVGAARLQLWNLDLATDTGFWIVGSGSLLFFSFDRATKEDRYFRRILGEILGVTILVELVLEISIFALPYELILVPATALLATMEVVAARDAEHEKVAGYAKIARIVAGLSVLGVGMFRAATDFDGLNFAQLGTQAVLPIWLTIGVLPFVYALALYARYEFVATQIDWRARIPWHNRAGVKAAVFREYGLKARRLGQLNGSAVASLSRTETWTEARAVIKNHRTDLEAQRVAELANEARLEQYAGEDGVDEEGRRLDRREFDRTCSALRWLHVCHMGWWRREDRYVDGLLAAISSPDDRRGLEPSAGFHEVVASDGTSWYAWRRTVSGWVFAIGASGVPPDQWLYDGPTPPRGPPGEDSAWGESPFGTTEGPNWQ